MRELKGFERVVLPAQTSRSMQFRLGPEARRYWSTTSRDWVPDSSVFDIWVGADSTAELTATFEVTDSEVRGLSPPRFLQQASVRSRVLIMMLEAWRPRN